MAVRLSQMTRNGMVCQVGSRRMASRLSPMNTTQAMSTQELRARWRIRSRRIQPTPLGSLVARILRLARGRGPDRRAQAGPPALAEPVPAVWAYGGYRAAGG